MEKVIQQRKKEIWCDERFYDVRFSFSQSGTSENSNILKTNRMILALCSPVFEAMFYGNLAEKRDPILIIDIERNVFKNLLRFIFIEQFEVHTLDDIFCLYYAANKYEIKELENRLLIHLNHHLFTYDLSEVKEFADMYFLDELKRLCEVHLNHNPLSGLSAHWFRWKKGDPIPTGMFFAHINEDKWPIGVCKFQNWDNRETPGTLYVKDMLARNGTHHEACENSDEFDILCDGNLDWVGSDNGLYKPKSVIVYSYFYIGKTVVQSETIIGKVEPSHCCLYVPYGKQELRIPKYFQLIDKNSTEVTKPQYMSR